MLATSLRVRPWTLRARRESSRRSTVAVLPSTLIVTSGSRVLVSVPFGPSTRTVPSATWSFTLSGMGIGRRPMRDMSLLSSPGLSPWLSPYLADDLAAHTLPPRFAVREDALRRGQDADAETAAHRGNVVLPHVDAQARTAHPADAGYHWPPALVVAEADAEDGERLFLDQGGVREVALLDQHACDRLLVPRPRHVDARLAGAGGVADAREHVGDGIGHHERVTSWPSRAPESAPCARGCGDRSGTCGTDGRRPAAARRADSGCKPGPGTSGAWTLSPSGTSSPFRTFQRNLP